MYRCNEWGFQHPPHIEHFCLNGHSRVLMWNNTSTKSTYSHIDTYVYMYVHPYVAPLIMQLLLVMSEFNKQADVGVCMSTGEQTCESVRWFLAPTQRFSLILWTVHKTNCVISNSFVWNYKQISVRWSAADLLCFAEAVAVLSPAQCRWVDLWYAEMS